MIGNKTYDKVLLNNSELSRNWKCINRNIFDINKYRLCLKKNRMHLYTGKL